MKISLKMLGGLRVFLPTAGEFSRCDLELSEGATINDVIARVGLAADRPFFIMFDGKKIQEDDYSAPLKEGDEVIMFPPVKGG